MLGLDSESQKGLRGSTFQVGCDPKTEVTDNLAGSILGLFAFAAIATVGA